MRPDSLAPGGARASAEPFPRFGDYQLIRRLATGGGVDLLLARKLAANGLGKTVVLKRLPREELVRTPSLVESFRTEARLGHRLEHPAIVRALDSGAVDGSPYIVTEYIAGEHLGAVLRRCTQRKTQIPVSIALRLASSLLLALEYAHGPGGVVHGGLSPSSLMVAYDGEIKLLDFGASRPACRRTDTQIGEVRGHVSWVAPEQVRGEPVDERTDIWGAGLILFEALTNQRLFLRASEQEVMDAILEEPLPTPDAFRPEVTAEIAAIVSQALQRDRKRRYPSAAAMRADLEALLARRRPVVDARVVGGFMNALFPEDVRREKIDLGRAAAAPESTTAPLAAVAPAHANAVLDEKTPIVKIGLADEPVSEPVTQPALFTPPPESVPPPPSAPPPPVAFTPAARASTPAPRAATPAPRAATPAPRAFTPAPAPPAFAPAPPAFAPARPAFTPAPAVFTPPPPAFTPAAPAFTPPTFTPAPIAPIAPEEKDLDLAIATRPRRSGLLAAGAIAVVLAAAAGVWVVKSGAIGRGAAQVPAAVVAAALPPPPPPPAPAPVAPPPPPVAAEPAPPPPEIVAPAPEPRVEPDAPARAPEKRASAAGPLTPREVAAAFARVRGRILDCFNLHSDSVSAHGGEITLSLLVLQSGVVREASIPPPSAGSPALDECIVSRAKNVRFRGHADKEVRINVPFVYRVTN